MVREPERERRDAQTLWEFVSRRAALRALGPEDFVRAVLRNASQRGAPQAEPELGRTRRRALGMAEAQEGGGGV